MLHTLNIRLFADQIVYVANHAEDDIIFVDRSLLALLWPLVDQLETVRHLVVMDDGEGEIPEDPRVLNYEDLIEAASPIDFAVRDE